MVVVSGCIPNCRTAFPSLLRGEGIKRVRAIKNAATIWNAPVISFQLSIDEINSYYMKLSNIYYLHEIGGKKNQEDYIWPPPGAATGSDRIFIVSDGVGGAENG